MLKNILSAVFAIIASVIIIGLLIKIMGFALEFLFKFLFLVIVVVIALPLFVVIKKKLFK